MSKRLTQLDRAIGVLETDIAELDRKYQSERQGLETAIARIRQQQNAKPKRKARIGAAGPTELRTATA